MQLLEVKNIAKEFDHGEAGKFLLFENISFAFSEDENFLFILAPLGSGKSTLLKIIAGLEPPSKGEILFRGQICNYPDGNIVYIPEKSSSLPWLSVKDNILNVLEGKKENNTGKKLQPEKIINLIGLEGYEDHYPDINSRGFRLRISIGRAVAVMPALILIDDSMKYLDQVTKNEIFEMIRGINSETGIKFLFAGTDISESVSLSDRIILLNGKPSCVSGEFKTGELSDTDSLLKIVASIKDILNKEGSDKSINFTI